MRRPPPPHPRGTPRTPGSGRRKGSLNRKTLELRTLMASLAGDLAAVSLERPPPRRGNCGEKPLNRGIGPETVHGRIAPQIVFCAVLATNAMNRHAGSYGPGVKVGIEASSARVACRSQDASGHASGAGGLGLSCLVLANIWRSGTRVPDPKYSAEPRVGRPASAGRTRRPTRIQHGPARPDTPPGQPLAVRGEALRSGVDRPVGTRARHPCRAV